MKNPLDSSQRREYPSDILPILRPTLQIGSLFGITGLLVGGTVGVLRSRTPTIFAVATGIQWFVFGSSFSASRSLVIHARAKGEDQTQSRDKILASSIAGAIAGSTAGSLSGLRNVVPGGVLFTIVGAAGQTLYNAADARQGTPATRSANSDSKSSWLNSKWSPIKVLSDDEYEKMLQEKLLQIDAEIGMVDESIMRERNTSAQSTANPQDAGNSST